MNTPTPSPLDDTLNQLREALNKLPTKKQKLITDWIIRLCHYIGFEDAFRPERVPRYRRGDIVYVDFGLNIGNEYGGVHYAAVLEANNHKKSGNIIVIPLTSLDADKTKDDIHAADLFLGCGIIPWTPYATIAKPAQVRAVSKMRIIKPLKKDDKRARLNDEYLEMIEDRLKQIIFVNPCLQEPQKIV
jgi:mRNA-degrading endonuclease toxin of MazEF toxin-antitoxin module